MLNGTPLLDVKPYIPDFDAYPDAIAGWQEKHKGKVRKQKSDARFT
jgi:tRNA (Thr-GGU) A37 N-methylase